MTDSDGGIMEWREPKAKFRQSFPKIIQWQQQLMPRACRIATEFVAPYVHLCCVDSQVPKPCGLPRQQQWNLRTGIHLQPVWRV